MHNIYKHYHFNLSLNPQVSHKASKVQNHACELLPSSSSHGQNLDHSHKDVNHIQHNVVGHVDGVIRHDPPHVGVGLSFPDDLEVIIWLSEIYMLQ